MGLLRLLWKIITLKPTGMADPDAIDLIVTDRKRGKLLLLITEHRPWDGEPMRQQFHAKANAYAHYVLSEKFTKDQPKHTARDVVVKLDCAYAPDDDTRAFFAKISDGLAQYGIGFECEVCG